MQCRRYDGTVLADANCLVAKPGTAQSCTQGTDAVCGTQGGLSQACNTQACVIVTQGTTCVVPPNGTYRISNSSSYYVNKWNNDSLIYATTIKVQAGGTSGCARVLSKNSTNYWYVGTSYLGAGSVTTSTHTFTSLGAAYGDDHGWRDNLTWIKIN